MKKDNKTKKTISIGKKTKKKSCLDGNSGKMVYDLKKNVFQFAQLLKKEIENTTILQSMISLKIIINLIF